MSFSDDSDSDSDDSLLLVSFTSTTTTNTTKHNSNHKRKHDTTTKTTTTTRANSNRKQNAAETKRSNLLDEMFLQQEERISRRRRMDETIKKEQEGFIPDQSDLIVSLTGGIGGDGIGGGGDKDPVQLEIGGGGGGGEKEELSRKEEGKDGGNNDDDNVDDGGDDDGHQQVTSGTKNNRNQIKDDSDSEEQGISSVNGRTARVDQQPIIPIKYDFDDPAYRARIEAIKEKSRMMMLKPHESRRQMQRQIEGLDVLGEYDEYDDDDEYEDAAADGGNHGDNDMDDNDQVCQSGGMNGGPRGKRSQREKDIERRLAEIAGAHSTLGMRRTLGWNLKGKINDSSDNDSDNSNSNNDAKTCVYFVPFESRNDALSELQALFKKYDCEPKSSSILSQDGMKLWKSVRENVIRPLKKAQDMQILSHMLKRDWKSHLHIPMDVVVWLIRVATTGNVTMFADLGSGTCEMALKVLERNMNIVQWLENKDGTKDMVVVSRLIWNMDDFVPMLQLMYGLKLWMPRIEKDHETNATEMNPKHFEEPSGLRHAMMIWTKAIHGGYVQMPENREKAKVCMTNAIAAVLFCGIDPLFHNGHGLLQIQGNLLTVLIQSIYKLMIDDEECTIEQPNDQLIEFEEWALSSAKYIIDSCQHYSSLPAISDEEDASETDNQGWLVMYMILRSWSIIHDKHVSIILFYSKLCHVALEKCLGWESTAWDHQVTKLALTMTQHVQRFKNENNNNSISNINKEVNNDNISNNSNNNNDTTSSNTSPTLPYRYNILATSETAFQEIAKPCKSFLSDTSRLLSTIWIASTCEQVAMELFHHNIIKRTKVSPIYRGFCENDSEASMLHDHFDRICASLLFVKKSIRIVLGKPFLRRSKELALLLQCTFDKQRDSVAKWDKRRKSSGVRRQSDLSTFLQKKVENGDDDGDDEDDVDDQEDDE